VDEVVVARYHGARSVLNRLGPAAVSLVRKCFSAPGGSAMPDGILKRKISSSTSIAVSASR